VRLTVRDLVFSHPGSPPVLRGVNLEATAGESIAIVGPSGSGKTTLLALIGGLLHPKSGAIGLTKNGLGDVEPVRREASWVLQTVNILADRTVADNVALGACADGVSRRQALTLAAAALRTVGLDGYGPRAVRTLSGGEVQRVVIARAVIGRRKVLLADEPTGQLDHDTSTTVTDALLSAARDRILVVVTHDAEVAARCSRTYHLQSGVTEPQ